MISPVASTRVLMSGAEMMVGSMPYRRASVGTIAPTLLAHRKMNKMVEAITTAKVVLRFRRYLYQGAWRPTGDRPRSDALADLEDRPHRAHDAGTSIQSQPAPEDVHRFDARAVGAQKVNEPHPPKFVGRPVERRPV